MIQKVALSIAGFFLIFFGAVNLDADERPNILMIMVDDLGWMDLRCQGNQRLTTPNLDRLAKQGMRFTDAYAAAPVCSPTRAAVLTGLSPATLQITNHIPDQKRFIPDDSSLLPAAMKNYLDTKHTTIAEVLKSKGYATGFFGKWHLAGERKPKQKGMGDLKYYPEKHGFDVNLGGCSVGGPFSFFDPYNLHNLPPRKKGEYMPDRLADEVIRFMKEQSSNEKPFLALLWNYTVHWPMEAPKKLLDKYRDRKDLGKLDFRYAAMIEAMDASMGKIFAALDELEIADETLVVFTSDNGAYGGVSDMKPLRAAKGYLYEGGLRVPLIIRWPGKIKGGTTCNTPVISMDFFPTFLDACGFDAAKHKTEGESLLPLLKKSGSLNRKSVFFHYPNFAFHKKNRLGSAIRKGDYKLIERLDDRSIELYHLKSDLGEKKNIAKDKPKLASEMLAELRQWRKKTGAALPIKKKDDQ